MLIQTRWNTCFNQRGNISTLNGSSLKLVEKFTYLGSSISSTENDMNTRLAKAWIAINRQLVIQKSDLTDKIKWSFYQAVVVSILLYECITWTLTKCMEKKLDSNYTRKLHSVRPGGNTPQNRSCTATYHPSQKLFVRRTRYARHCWRTKDKLISDILLWTTSHGWAKVGQPVKIYIQQLYADTGYGLEDLMGVMDDRDGWLERVKEIRAGSMTWRWWNKPRNDILIHWCMCVCIYIYIYIYKVMVVWL